MVELATKDPEKGGNKGGRSGFTMDEAFLNDLLECSVCLEQLDSTSKVLPCQHTFCKRCLQEIVNSHKELRCPECRIVVESKIEELPCNILLVRLLEGIKNNVRPKKGVEGNTRTTPESGQLQTPPHPQLPQPLGNLPRTPSSTDLRMVSKQVLHACPCAKALYPYEAKVPGDLTFKKGDVIILRKRADQNWFYGELGGKSGFVPASFVQVVVPIPSHVPQCKALYDFQISSSEEKDCLTFGKGDILTVIRRIDDHWAEGKLRDRIGIFPISFVEMNAAARAVMKLSSNAQLSSRILPPAAPSTDSHFGNTTTTSNAQSPQYQPEPTTSAQPASSGSGNTPFSPPSFSPSPTHTSQASYPGTSYDGHAGHCHRTAAGAKDQEQQPPSESGGDNTAPAVVVNKSRSTPSPAFASITPPLVTQRAESISGGHTPTQNSSQEDSPSSPLPTGDAASKTSHAPARSTSATHVPVPTFYLALYTYRPLKEDELELRKGELYTVSEKCQDGWFKGTSLRTGLSGVFPGNYVQIAKSAVLQPHIGVSIAGRTSPATSTTSPPPTSSIQSQQRTSFSGIATTGNPHLFQPISTQGVIYTNSPITLCGRGVPATSTSPVSPAHPAVLEWAHSIAVAAPLQRIQRPVSSVGAFSPALYKSEMGPKQNGFPCGQTRSLAMAPWTSLCAIDFNSSNVADFPSSRTTNESPTRMLSYQSSSTAAQHVSSGDGNSTAQQQPRYSISQPSTPLMMPHAVPPNTNPFVTPDRLGPPATSTAAGQAAAAATSSQARGEKHKEKKEKEIVSLMKRLTKRKSKSPPPSDYSCDNPSFVDGTSPQQSLSAVHVRSTSCPSEALGSQVNHKKTGSLDGSNNGDAQPKTSSSRPKQPAPLVRERFRCIVPYPPNSDYELELKVGDVVYVHKKREDGWYKGTLQRTGKTGLFPSSFVEGF
ncbi:hypothetical protein JTE90_013133 [Oedothorax gibbosus]|uniref:RING-type E3 ubiquitin transferase n=1 Tax=Oedothorax gibbosus TaxID=931172 RepID=A0AAV6VLQ8_9ARAC|nr:hypothetical protein JTE90_013133 [Oedothorax gibbosus]